MCDDYVGEPWDIVRDACWQTASATDKQDFLIRLALLASVVVVFVFGFLVMRK